MESPTSSPVDGSELEHRLASISEAFLDELRRGARPTVAEYAARYPDIGEELSTFLETVRAMEQGWNARPVANPLHPPERIGEYRLLGELGSGGMGIVYLAEQESLARRVALKLIRPETSDNEAFLERFRREARVAGKLQHPNIVPVYGSGEEAGLAYYAMQAIDGEPVDRVMRELRAGFDAPSGRAQELAHRLESGRLSEQGSGWRELPDATAAAGLTYENAARITSLLADAVGYAHSEGVLHRDLKPSNVLLDRSGHVWITDFGLCRANEDEPLTTTHDFVGTLRYSSPEQLDGHADGRSDLYGLGLILYELCTRRVPYEDASRGQLTESIRSGRLVPPRRIDPELPRDLEAIVLKATAALPDERYWSADALARDLRNFLEGRPVKARPPGWGYLLRLAVRRNRPAALILVAAALVLAVLISVFVTGLVQARNEQARQMHQAHMNLMGTLIEENYEEAIRVLDAIPERFRGWEWDHFRAAADSSLEVEQVYSGSQYGNHYDGLQASSDGRWLVFATGRELHVRSTEGSWSLKEDQPIYSVAVDGNLAATSGRLKSVTLYELAPEPRVMGSLDHPDWAVSLALDAESRSLFVGGYDGSVSRWDVDLQTRVEDLPGHGSAVWDLSSEAGWLASSSHHGELQLTRLASGETQRVRAHFGVVWSVSISADGSTVATGSEDGTVGIWDTDVLALRTRLIGHSGRVTSVALDSTGRWAASGSRDGSIRTWDADLGSSLASFPGHTGFVDAVAYQERTRRLWSFGEDGTLRQWGSRAWGGKVRFDCPGLGDFAFFPDSRRIVTHSKDRMLRILDASLGRTLRVLWKSDLDLSQASVGVTPDGSEVVCADAVGKIHFWSTASSSTRRINTQLPNAPPPGHPRSVKVTPDGRTVLVLYFPAGLASWQRDPEFGELQAYRNDLSSARLALDPRGEWVALGGYSGIVRMLAPDTLVETRSWSAHAPGHVSVCVRSDGQRLYTLGTDGILRTWNREGRLMAEVEATRGGDATSGITVDPTGARIAIYSSQGPILLIDPERGERVATLPTAAPTPYAQFSPDGRRIVGSAWSIQSRAWDTLPASQRSARQEAYWRNESSARAAVSAALESAETPFDACDALLEMPLDEEVRELALSIVSSPLNRPTAMLAAFRQKLASDGLDPEEASAIASVLLMWNHVVEIRIDFRATRLEALYRAGRTAEAIELGRRVVGYDRERFASRALLALALHRSGERDEAVETARSAWEAHDPNVAGDHDRGLAEELAGVIGPAPSEE